MAFFILNLTSFFENTFQNIYYEFNKTLNYIGDNRVFRSYYRHWTRCVPYLITPERKELDFPYVGESLLNEPFTYTSNNNELYSASPKSGDNRHTYATVYKY